MSKKIKIDVTNENQSYWEKILSQEGLSMERGGPNDRKHFYAVLVYLEKSEQKVSEAELNGFTII